MKITVIGSGYVGLVSATCFAEMGHDVLCLDLDAKKIENLNKGIISIHEPGLEEMNKRNVVAGRLSFTTNVQAAAEHGDVQFIAVGTPPAEDGSADLQYVLAAAKNIARYMNRYTVVVNKSTVPMGSAMIVELAIQSILLERGENVKFSVVSNPEFLKEGAAIEDFMRPDRIVIGTDSDEAYAIMQEIYSAFAFKNERTIRMDTLSAELTKYAANAMLATRISFMNDLARLAEKAGANIDHVRKGMGSDSRIGRSFLYAGAGYGGSCFPKDVQALIRTGHEYGVPLSILEAVEEVNREQKEVLAEKVISCFGDVTGMKFAVWGLAFKPNTDDMREAPSTPMIQRLMLAGAEIIAYDPVAEKEAEKIYAGEKAISFSRDAIGALKGADALIIVTEWKEFRAPPWDMMKRVMGNPIIFDGRNIYPPDIPRKHGFTYFSIGRPGIEAYPETSPRACIWRYAHHKRKHPRTGVFLLPEKLFQESYIFIESRDIFRILVMECLSFFRDKDDIIRAGSANIRNRIIETTTKKVTSDGCFCMLPGKYHSEPIVSDFIRKDIGYESIRKKRFPKS